MPKAVPKCQRQHVKLVVPDHIHYAAAHPFMPLRKETQFSGSAPMPYHPHDGCQRHQDAHMRATVHGSSIAAWST